MSEEKLVSIRSVRTVEQLEKAGGLLDIVAHINKIIAPFTVPETVLSFEGLLPFALKANQVVAPDITYEKESEMFATHRASVLFCLTASPITSTMDRLEFLEFPDEFHDEPKKYQKNIKRWFNKLKSDIESQRRTDETTHKAALKIDDIKKELEDLLDIEIGNLDEDESAETTLIPQKR